MHTLTLLLGLAAGQALPDEEDTKSRRLQLGLIAFLFALVFAAIYGVAAGSSGTVSLMLGNIVKVPVVILLATVGTLPAGFLAWKLSGARIRGSDLLLSYGAATFAGTMVLAATSPLVALYYQTSAWGGPVLGLGTVFLALGAGCVMFVRSAWKRAHDRAMSDDAPAPYGTRARPLASVRSVLVPVFVILAMQLASLVQLVALASPILPEVTVFDGGVDRMLGQ